MTEELKHVHERLDTIGNNALLINHTNTNSNLSYAEVARTPPNSLPGNVVSISSLGTTPSTITDTLYCTIDTSKVANEDTDTSHCPKPVAQSVDELPNYMLWNSLPRFIHPSLEFFDICLVFTQVRLIRPFFFAYRTSSTPSNAQSGLNRASVVASIAA